MKRARRPSDVAQERVSGWYGRRSVSYCEELRTHRAEFADTRQRSLIALAFVAVIGVAIGATGRGAMAVWFGLLPGIVLLLILGGNEWLLRRVDRKIANDCADGPESRDLSDPRAPHPPAG